MQVLTDGTSIYHREKKHVLYLVLDMAAMVAARRTLRCCTTTGGVGRVWKKDFSICRNLFGISEEDMITMTLFGPCNKVYQL